MKKVMTLLMLLGFVSSSVFADGIESIQLQNRLAEEIMPILQPMLGPEDALSGQGFQLFLRTSDDNLAQLRQMINELDRAPRLLLISVFQGEEHELRRFAVSGDFDYQGNQGDIRLGRSAPFREGADFNYNTRNAALGVQTLSTHKRLSDTPVHQLRITEGAQGYIQTGESIPYFSGGYWRQGRGNRHHGIVGGMEYKAVMTGFYVTPRVQGELVNMTVSPYKQGRSQQQGGAIETSGASTQITGPLGQWLLIGGVTEQAQKEHHDMTKVISTRGEEDRGIWIKAELVK